jgi:NADPH:quinone reductase-like Zn-dependent oxidoreductase
VVKKKGAERSRPVKAAVIDRFGGAEVLQIRDVPVPEPGDGEVLVQVRAAGVNPVDWKIREGYLKEAMGYRFPLVLGMDGAGVVKEAGRGADTFASREEPVFFCNDMGRMGTYAEYVVVRQDLLARKPDNVSFEGAAAVPLVALTAWQALLVKAGLTDGMRVLVHAGWGGVGSFAVQLAKVHAAHVASTCGPTNVDFVKALGADEAVDYTREDFAERLGEYDIVLDTVGGDVYRRSFQVLRKGGVVVSLLERPDAALAGERGVRAEYLLMRPDGGQLAEVAQLLREERIRPVVGTVLPLKDVRSAHELSASRHARGKIVLAVPGS